MLYMLKSNVSVTSGVTPSSRHPRTILFPSFPFLDTVGIKCPKYLRNNQPPLSLSSGLGIDKEIQHLLVQCQLGL